jgi:hypothetical protein
VFIFMALVSTKRESQAADASDERQNPFIQENTYLTAVLMALDCL